MAANDYSEDFFNDVGATAPKGAQVPPGLDEPYGWEDDAAPRGVKERMRRVHAVRDRYASAGRAKREGLERGAARKAAGFKAGKATKAGKGLWPWLKLGGKVAGVGLGGLGTAWAIYDMLDAILGGEEEKPGLSGAQFTNLREGARKSLLDDESEIMRQEELGGILGARMEKNPTGFDFSKVGGLMEQSLMASLTAGKERELQRMAAAQQTPSFAELAFRAGYGGE